MRPQALGLSLHGSAILLKISSDLVVKSHQKEQFIVGWTVLFETQDSSGLAKTVQSTNMEQA